MTLLATRRRLRSLEPDRQHENLCDLLRRSKKAWHGVKLNQPDWSKSSHSLAITAEMIGESLLFHLMLNAYWEPLEFELPPLDQKPPRWRRWIDTSLDSPDDIAHWQMAPEIISPTYRVESRSVVVLFAVL